MTSLDETIKDYNTKKRIHQPLRSEFKRITNPTNSELSTLQLAVQLPRNIIVHWNKIDKSRLQYRDYHPLFYNNEKYRVSVSKDGYLIRELIDLTEEEYNKHAETWINYLIKHPTRLLGIELYIDNTQINIAESLPQPDEVLFKMKLNNDEQYETYAKLSKFTVYQMSYLGDNKNDLTKIRNDDNYCFNWVVDQFKNKMEQDTNSFSIDYQDNQGYNINTVSELWLECNDKEAKLTVFDENIETTMHVKQERPVKFTTTYTADTKDTIVRSSGLHWPMENVAINALKWEYKYPSAYSWLKDVSDIIYRQHTLFLQLPHYKFKNNITFFEGLCLSDLLNGLADKYNITTNYTFDRDDDGFIRVDEDNGTWGQSYRGTLDEVVEELKKHIINGHILKHEEKGIINAFVGPDYIVHAEFSDITGKLLQLSITNVVSYYDEITSNKIKHLYITQSVDEDDYLITKVREDKVSLSYEKRLDLSTLEKVINYLKLEFYPGE